MLKNTVSTTEMNRRLLAWLKCRLVPGSGHRWAYDANGNLICWNDYGDRQSPYGWEIDHFPIPKSMGGSDHPTNLRALHFRDNAAHGALLGGLAALLRK